MPESKYGQGWGGSVFQDLTCPSGAVCAVRVLQPDDLIGEDALGAMDLLGPKIREMIAAAQTPSPSSAAATQKAADLEKSFAELQGVFNNPERVLSFMDKVVIMAVVVPKLHIPPEDYAKRDDALFYIDTVGLSDKIHIFSHAMKGMKSLERFPDASQNVDDVEGSAVVSDPAERAAGHSWVDGILPGQGGPGVRDSA